jgi:hypothetical protein
MAIVVQNVKFSNVKTIAQITEYAYQMEYVSVKTPSKVKIVHNGNVHQIAQITEYVTFLQDYVDVTLCLRVNSVNSKNAKTIVQIMAFVTTEHVYATNSTQVSIALQKSAQITAAVKDTVITEPVHVDQGSKVQIVQYTLVLKTTSSVQ